MDATTSVPQDEEVAHHEAVDRIDHDAPDRHRSNRVQPDHEQPKHEQPNHEQFHGVVDRVDPLVDRAAVGRKGRVRLDQVAYLDETDHVDHIVGQWGRERPDLDTRAMAVFGRIFRLARIAGDQVEKAYGAFGIGRAEFDVLAALRRAGDPYQLSPGALSASMMLSTGGTTARLDRLERVGLVERLPSPSDRRSVLVRLTEAGFDIIEQAVGAGLAEQQRLLAQLPADRLRQLDDLLREAMDRPTAANANVDMAWIRPA